MSSSPDTQELQSVMHSIIQRIATGPELSKNITQEEAKLGMQAILEEAVDPVQAAIFFIALRMKRETDDENKGVLDAILASTDTMTADVDEVVYIVDPYNGYNRSLPPSPFLPAVLAECGVNTITHGVESVGPKYGVTHYTVLKSLGIDVDLSTQAAADRLANPDIGWSYLDQSALNPKLNNLLGLRKKMVKRQVITTTEVLVRPIAGRKKTHLVTGYVHKPYPPKYAALARHAGFSSNLLIRGVEGGVIPSLRQAGKSFFYKNMGELQEIDTDPTLIGINQDVRITPLPEELPTISRPGDEIAIAVDIAKTSQLAAEAGVAALEGTHGSTYDALVYSGAMILLHVGKAQSMEDGAAQIRAALDSGKARARLC